VLVLSRKKNESIVINDDIKIVVVEIRGDKVRLGIEAPKHIPVHRQEVFDAIHRKNDPLTGEEVIGNAVAEAQPETQDKADPTKVVVVIAEDHDSPPQAPKAEDPCTAKGGATRDVAKVAGDDIASIDDRSDSAAPMSPSFRVPDQRHEQ